jgi:hypothetical protein
MRTNPLIDRLTSDLKPVRRRTPFTDGAALAVLAVFELGLFLSMGFMRPDMPLAMCMPSFWWKLTSLGLIALVSGTITVLSLDPVRSPRRGLRWTAALIGVCLAVGGILDASGDGFSALYARLNWLNGLQCLCKMVVLSVPAVIGLGVLMRRAAPTDRDGTALAAGLAAAAWGAFVFVFACPFDDPFYVAVWYSLGCGAVTFFARYTLPLLTRW